MATNWLQDAAQTDLWDTTIQPTQTDTSAWWAAPSVGLAVPRAYGKRLGSYRLQNEAAQRAAREAALTQLGATPAQSTGATEQGSQSLISNPQSQAATPAIQAPAAAPDWLTGIAGPGNWLRELIRPDQSLIQRGGQLLQGVGTALGSLAQGAEGAIGSLTSQIPTIGGELGEGANQRVQGKSLSELLAAPFDPYYDVKQAQTPEYQAAMKKARETEGLISLRPSAAQQAATQATETQQYLGQDYTQKYRSQANWTGTPLINIGGDINSPAAFADYQTRNIAYSQFAVGDARQKASQRILLGEDPTIVLRGMEKPATEAYSDEWARWQEKAQEYMASQGRAAKVAALKQGASAEQADALAQQASEEAGRWIDANNRIPGEENVAAELGGQIALDPLNLPGANKVIEAATGKLVSKAKGVDQAAKNATTVYDDALSAELKAYQTGLSSGEQKMVSAASKSQYEVLQKLGKNWEKLRGYTAETQAKRLAGTAFNQVGQLVNDAPTGADALQVIDKFVKDPDSLMAHFGALPKNMYSEAARPVVAKALDQIKNLPSLKAAQFNPMDFIVESYDAFDEAARTISGAAAKGTKPSGVLGWANSMKQWMSEFYLRTPGYIARNAVSDTAIAQMDGLNMFDDMTYVRGRLEQYGVLTRRVSTADEALTGAADVLGSESKLSKVPLIGKWQNKVGQWATKAEEGRYLRAYDSALQQFKATNWAPKLSDSTRALFEQAGMGNVADAIEAGWKQGMSAKDLRKVSGSVLGASHPAEQFFVTKFGVDPLDLSPDMAAEIERNAREIAKRGGTAEEFGQYIDTLMTQAQQKAANGLVDMGVITKPRATTEVNAAQDVADEVRQAEMELARSVNHGEMTREDAAKLLEQHRTGLMQQAQQRAEAVTALRDALGQVPEGASDDVLAAALHPVDLEYEAREATRLQVDALWTAEKRKPKASRNWAQYFDSRRQLWGEANNQTIQAYQKSASAIQELGGGADAVATRAKYGISSLTDKADQLLQQARERVFKVDLTATAYGKKATEAERAGTEAALQQFSDERLKPLRVQWDEARADARRYLVQMVKTNPELTQDGMDIWVASQRAVDLRFTQAAARQEGWISRMLNDEISLDEYRKLSGEEWDKAFNFATTHNGEQTVARLRSLEQRRGLVAQRLQQLGYQGEDLKRMVSGFSDGSTKDEVVNIITNNTSAPRAAQAAPGIESTGPNLMQQALQPPASADEWLASNGGDVDAALKAAQQSQEQVAGLVDFGVKEARTGAGTPALSEINRYIDANGQLKNANLETDLTELANRYSFIPNPDVPGGEVESIRTWLEQSRATRQAARNAPGKAASAAAEDAYGKWQNVIDELQDRAKFAGGASAEEVAARDFVRQTVQGQGLGQAAQTVRDIASGGTAQDQLMLDELAQIARERATATVESADDIGKAYTSVEKTLADALFGTRNVAELNGVTAAMGDVQAEARALEQFRLSNKIPNVPGLESERTVETIRALAKELNLNPDEFLLKADQGINDVIQAARAKNSALVDQVLNAETVHADGRIKKADWDKLGLSGERSTPGDVLTFLAESNATTGTVDKAALAQRVANATTLDDLKAAVGSDAHVMRHGDRYGPVVSITNRKAGINAEGHGNTVEEAIADVKRQLGAVEPGSAGAGVQGSMPGVPGQGAVATSGTQIPEEVQKAEALVAKRQQQLRDAQAAYAQGQTDAQAIAVDDARARAKAAGMQASEVRKKYGIQAPTQRAATTGNQGMVDNLARAIQGKEEVSVESIMRDYKLSQPNAQKAFDAAQARAIQWNATSGKAAEDMPSIDELTAADEAVEKSGGAAEPLGMEDQLTAAEKKQIAALQKIKAGLTQDWTRVADPKGLPKGAWKAVETDLQAQIPQWYTFKNAATYAAQQRADFSMLDYSLKRGADMGMSTVAPYYYWGSRQARNYAIRFMQRPQYLVAMQRYKTAMHKMNVERGTRSRFEGYWEVPGTNGTVFIDPTAFIFPYADLIRTDTSDASDSRSLLANIYEGASQLGMRPGPWIDLPVRGLNLLVNAQPGTPEYEQQVADVGSGSVGSLLPQAQMIKGATALAGIGPAGGIDIERPVRQALGLSEAQPFEPYLATRAVRDLAAERGVTQDQKTSYLLASAIIASAGDATSGISWNGLLNGNVSPDTVAKLYNTDVTEAQAALQITRDAINKAAQQKGVSTLASGVLGAKVQVQPQGEQQFLQAQTMERGAAYSPYTQVGSRADVETVRQANPVLEVGRAQYATLPGDTSTPGQAYQYGRRDVVNSAFDALKDAVIQSQPWDRKASMAIEDGRSKALDAISGTTSGTNSWQAAYQEALAAVNGQGSTTSMTYTPRSINGANPTEAVQIRKDELMRFVSASRPSLEDFTNASSGMPDYKAYQAAVAEWEQQLPQLAAQNPLVQQVVQQAGADGMGAQVSQYLKKLTLADVQNYWKRNDTPLEAAQRAWYDQVYTPAVEKARRGGTKINESLLPATGETSTDELIGMVQQTYGDRWTGDELKQALDGMTMPELKKVVRSQMSTAARTTAERSDEFGAYVAQKWGTRGAKAYTAYQQADGADAKAKVRKRYPVLQRILAARTEFNNSNSD